MDVADINRFLNLEENRAPSLMHGLGQNHLFMPKIEEKFDEAEIPLNNRKAFEYYKQ